MDKKQIGIIAVVAIIIIIAGVALMQSTSVERNDNELVIAAGTHGGEPENGFDPMTGWGDRGEPLIQSTLLKMQHNLTYDNDLAENYTISDDLKTYTVNIKSGIKFHDNSPLTAEDVAFTYNTAKEMGQTIDLSNMINATAINDNTVVFKLNKSDSTFLPKLAHLGIVPSDSYDNDTYGSKPIGSGPYKFVQWDKGQQLILEKNPDYYGNGTNFEKLTILFLKNDATLAAAQKGEVDIAEVPLSLSNETVENMQLVQLPSMDVRGISLPNVPDEGKTTEDGAKIGNNVTSDLSIREALNYRINRSEIITGSFNGRGVACDDPVATTLPWSDNSTIKDGDIEKAKQILADGGWKDTDGDGIVEKNGTKASFELNYASDDPLRQSICVAVSEQAKEIGIEITPEGKTWDEMDLTKNSNAVIWGFGTDDPSFLYHEYYSDLAGVSYDNPGFVNNSMIDANIEKAMSSDIATSYNYWGAVGKEASPETNASWLWIGQVDYCYFVDNSLDISKDTTTIQPHGGDIFGNIFDWKRVGSINK